MSLVAKLYLDIKNILTSLTFNIHVGFCRSLLMNVMVNMVYYRLIPLSVYIFKLY